ncbi:MAG: fatty acid desaturase [Phycisphaerae bacterium]|nr:fatty acid desaturase [Phycisphaerae bacterium]
MLTTDAPRSSDLPVDLTATERLSKAPHVIAGFDDGYEAKPSLKLRLVTLMAVVIPFLGFIAAIVLLWGVAFSWTYLILFLAMYTITAMGVTVGYHRLFTHRAFAAPKPVAALLAIAGSMSVQGPILYWVATHRRHHQHSDDDGDPHSPHLHGDTVVGALKGMVHAHVGWLFRSDHRALSRYIVDLTKDPFVCMLSRLFPLWVAIGLILPAILGGLITMSWMGVLLGFLWGGLARMFFCHHVTWSINSVCHIWGSRPFRSDDESRNNPIFGVLAFGEGWHNNHHAFPTSARHGLRWWQIDMSYWFIRGLELVGLARDVRVPSRERMDAKRAH